MRHYKVKTIKHFLNLIGSLGHHKKFGHLSRIRAHPIYLTIQFVCVQQLYTLFRYIINTYIMHKCTLILCIVTHLQRFSDNEMYAN